MAARNADGNITAQVKNINGVRHTLTAWKSKEAMKAFIYAEPHLSVIRAFPSIATGKTFGYEAEVIPDWDEVHRRWHSEGRDYA